MSPTSGVSFHFVNNKAEKMHFAVVFPGQGSQYVGMGADIYKAFPHAKKIFDQANDILSMDLSQICFSGPQDKLCCTDISQPAILTHSIALLECYKAEHPEIKESFATCGLSLGEYTALVFAGALSFEQALRLVKRRGELMQEACNLRQGGMISVIGLSEPQVLEAIEQVNKDLPVNIANINAPDQIVVSGAKEALTEVAALLKKRNGRTIPLKVAGAFHSVLMKPAEEKLAQEIHRSKILTPNIPIVSNVSADYLKDSESIKHSLIRQLTSPVRWASSIQRLLKDGVGTFYEIGPGNVLTGLLKRIDPNAKGNNIEKLEHFQIKAV